MVRILKFDLIIALLVLFCNDMFAITTSNKREFRGAWIQCVNGQFQGLSTSEIQNTLSYQLDELQKDGVNTIIFQVRAECDALYQSKYEPWSKFLTGEQGKAPSPYWDPLSWMIMQCHSRGMEIHAWINPFRAKTKNTNRLAYNHISIQHPELVFHYDGLDILNPGIPENRDYICKIVDDIVSRYDVDGIHIDDYFYPYPASGQTINDQEQFQKYNNGIKDINDWRRDNVNIFIKQLSDSIHSIKPWVKFGVSPFGIYRNASSSPKSGSDTRGLQDYDDLYADVLLWVNNGWIDYCAPQLYWQIGNKAADYDVLIKWWNKYAANRPLYIGEDVERTAKYSDLNNPDINQMPAKFRLHRQMNNVSGTVLWYAKAVVDNIGNYGLALRNDYWKNPALQPTMPFIDKKAPKKPRKLKPLMVKDDYVLFWTAPKGKGWQNEAVKYVVYRFENKENINLNNSNNIISITSDNFIKLPYVNGKRMFTYIVTALDRMSNESKGSKKKIRL
jgi:uncharacterized lipoprotein YddW (UPF0748 family)